MFLGTPHRGSQTADLGSVISDVVNVAAKLGSLGLAKKPLQVGILNELRVGSKALRELHETFVKRASHPSQLPICSFIETQDTVFAGKSLGIVSFRPIPRRLLFTDMIDFPQIVDEISGSTDLPQDDIFPTERSHVTICRFSRNEQREELWPDVRRYLRDVVRLCQTPVDENVTSSRLQTQTYVDTSLNGS